MNLFKFLVLFNVINVLTTQNIKNDSDTKILSRKRRYLTFPEGSSLQLIYDQTIPIVGIELVFTVGITVALAWELPSEPLYKLTQKLRYRLKHPDGEDEKKEEEVKKPEEPLPLDHDHDHALPPDHDHDALPADHDHDALPMDHAHDAAAMPVKDDKSRFDKFTNLIKYVDTGAKPWYPSNQIPMSNKYDYYFNGYKNNKLATSPIKYYTNSNSNSNGIYYGPNQNKWSLSNLFTPENRRNIVNVVSNFAQKLNGRPLNRGDIRKPAYPIFGKRRRRSVEEEIHDEEEKIFIEHHRTTRKELYKKIERFLVSHKRDGQQCVLRALCETGQQHHEKGKGTFVAEIMRVIFSLPKSPHDKHEEDIHHYDVAHQHGPEKNCAKLFPKCEESIWSSDFIF